MKHKIITSLLVCSICISIVGCSNPLSKKEETPAEPQLTEEQQALIGTFTDTGEYIVGFDADGFMITETPEASIEDAVGVTAQELLAKQDIYTNFVITAYSADNKPIYVQNIEVDPVSKISKKSWITKNSTGTLYFDTATNKGYVNNNSSGWSEDNNNQIKNTVIYFNPDRMRNIEMDANDLYIKVTGEIDRTAIDRSPLMTVVADLYPSTTTMNLEAYYDRDTHFLKRAEVTCNTTSGSYLITVTVIPEEVSITIPEYVTNQEIQEVSLVSGITHIPTDAYIWDVLYDVEDVTKVDRNYLINTYQFKAAELKKTYESIDVNAFLEQMEVFDLTKSVEMFVNEYQQAQEFGFASIEEKAIYESMYNRLMSIDGALTEMNEDYQRRPADKKRAEELTLEQNDLIGTEAEDGSGIIEWFWEDGTPIITPYEEKPQEEPEYTIMYATTLVNKRTGPGTNHDKAGQCKEGEPVKVVRQSEENPEWSECVDDEGNTFYIKSSYLK